MEEDDWFPGPCGEIAQTRAIRADKGLLNGID
jgi:hypothetical protein